MDNLVKWPAYFGDETFYAFNKIALISVLAVILPSLLFLFSKKSLVPVGAQNVTESIVDFVDKQVIQATIGPEGRRYLPLLLTLFLFIFFGNIFEIIPTFQMPANARMANPMVLALIVWFVYVGVGIRHNGFSFIKSILRPPGVPLVLVPLMALIELISTFILRPFSLAVRLFANMFAGHLLLVTFTVLSITLFKAFAPAALLPFAFLVVLTAFEAMVSFLQAFIFALLAAVYIDLSLHPQH